MLVRDSKREQERWGEPSGHDSHLMPMKGKLEGRMVGRVSVHPTVIIKSLLG